ncbi:MAG: ATP-binding cassette domain-containing protein [candidate division Zixibacteria bacterium]|nr:ATP-binding cassette domain-containing protein [candidate division Zixibacteria bacterium]
MGEYTSEPVVSVRCARHIYQDRTEVDICGLDFEIFARERVAVLGPNGCGKTTLLKHVLGMLEPVEGEVSVFGVNPAHDFGRLVGRIGVVLQNVDEQILGPTVFDDVAFTPRNLGTPREEVDRRVRDVLAALKIEKLARKIVHYVSGGEKKLVALAGALVTRPELLILDEPLEWLDPMARERVVSYLRKINEERGTTLIFATHEVAAARELATRAYLMKAGGELGAAGRVPALLARADLAEYNLVGQRE